MQLPNSPAADKFQTIANAIQHERLMRYMPAAGKRLDVSFKFYVWNGKIYESFHPTLHYAEILCRNAFNNSLISRAGADWFLDRTLINLLGKRFSDELLEAVRSEKNQHGAKMTAHHVVSALNFGFWDHLATKRFDRYLWAAGVQQLFPNAPSGTTREDVQKRIESVRRWRNRIAHHRAIFDKGPMRKHSDALELIGWVCVEIRAWVAGLSEMPAIIALRPKP